MKIVLVALALLFSGCLTATGIASAPNGAVWLAGNIPMDGPAIYLCNPREGVMRCSRVPIRNDP